MRFDLIFSLYATSPHVTQSTDTGKDNADGAAYMSLTPPGMEVCTMYMDEYKRWLAADLEDPDLKPELLKIADDDEAIKDRFAVSLAFGTAGLRGTLGAGTNRMNIWVVRQATQGAANWVKTQGGCTHL